LLEEIIGVQDRAAFKGLTNMAHSYFVLGTLDFDLGAGGDIRAFLSSTSQAHADVGGFFLCAFLPTEIFRSGLEHRSQTGVFEMRQSELKRINACGRS